ncbi:MAG TPA: TIGR03960 family B12-binding radical SAM protein [Thermoguttaceae bacterium]
MLNEHLKKQIIERLLPLVQTPGQYVGGEWNALSKDHRAVKGTICLAFPDAYSIGMSHLGLQILYAVMNSRDWACERVFTPLADMENLLREHGIPLYSLETFTPLNRFDVLGFSLQYDLCYANVLTMLDLGGIPLTAEARAMEHPLVIAGGPCALNPEPMARFFDLFIIGDGEEALPEVCDQWIFQKKTGADRQSMLAEMARRFPFVYVPRFYRPQFNTDGKTIAVRPVQKDFPECVQPAVVDLQSALLPTAPVVPHVECVHERIAIEIMRGCPGKCRFCQSTTLKRPLRFRQVETIVQAALETYRKTGYNEVSLLSLSTSDYPHFDKLVERLQDAFATLYVGISLPSLRVNESLRLVGELISTFRHSSLTLAPEVALDDMREQIAKHITNEDLYAGCRKAFEKGFNRVKLYFMCGLPGERKIDLDGIIEMSQTIARLGKEVSGRFPTVVANIANFVPKPQTPYQWNAMQRREYFLDAHRYLRKCNRMRCVQLKCHDVESSLLEAALCRGDRRMGDAIELAWRRGARLDAWAERLNPGLWWQAMTDCSIDVDEIMHVPYPACAPLPWDHIGIRQGRSYLEREHSESTKQLERMVCH